MASARSDGGIKKKIFSKGQKRNKKVRLKLLQPFKVTGNVGGSHLQRGNLLLEWKEANLSS